MQGDLLRFALINLLVHYLPPKLELCSYANLPCLVNVLYCVYMTDIDTVHICIYFIFRNIYKMWF